MATNNKREFLGRGGTEQLVASVKTLVNELGAVSFKVQSLTSAQKTQARANLGITGTGADGYTPVRGTDYWTDADKAEIKAYIDEAINVLLESRISVIDDANGNVTIGLDNATVSYDDGNVAIVFV